MSKIIIQQVRDHLAEVEKLLPLLEKDTALNEVSSIEWWAKTKYAELKTAQAMERYK